MPRTGKAELVRLAFRILAAVDAELLTRHELADRFGVSPQIVGRQIRFLRDSMGVRMKTVTGYGYEVADWGILDREKFLMWVADTDTETVKAAKNKFLMGFKRLNLKALKGIWTMK